MVSFTMNVPASVKRPDVADNSLGATGWKTILFNCDCHSFHEVAAQLVCAIRCDFQRGLALANVIHLTGSATVYRGSRQECESVAKTLAAIGLRVSVSE
jgi:hypothetical protein